MFGNRLSRNARGALLVAALTMGLIGIFAVPAAASRSCAATTLKQGGRARVFIARGSISCSAARGIVRLTLLFGAARASLSSSAADVTTRARSAAACAREHVDGGKYLGELTLRFGLIGRVSCAKAHHLAHTYFHKFATGQCGQQNNFCDLTFNGWSCSFFFATEIQETGGAKAGCAQEHGRARVRFYWDSRQQQAAGDVVGTHSVQRLRPAVEHFRDCGRFNALHVEIEAYRVSCARSVRVVRAYLHDKRAGAVPTRVKGFPAWTCSVGTRSGSCDKGRIRVGGPEIGFFWLAQPR